MLGSTVYFPGANDNASGIALLLNLLHYYSIHPSRYSILFVAFSAEEAGLLGAAQFVRNPPCKLTAIKFLINFDLVGTGDEGIKVVNGSVYTNEFARLRMINDRDALVPKVEARGKACNSDHCVFSEKGVPCFYIYTLGGIKAYHDPDDRAQTLPLTEFADLFRLTIRFLDGF
jgi:Zn-dependent M28 family amino/carboxypeptidase